MDQDRPPPRSRGIYLLPNLFTTCGLFAGFYAIIAAANSQFTAAAIAVFVAAIMDGLDGRGADGDVGRLRVRAGDEEGKQRHAAALLRRSRSRRLATGQLVADHLFDELARGFLRLGGGEIHVDRDAGRQHHQTERGEKPSQLAHDRLRKGTRGHWNAKTLRIETGNA